MADITTIGEILIDLTQTGVNEQGVPILSANPGGAPANVAVAASKLESESAFIGCIGNDAFGDLLRKTLQDYRVDITGLCETKESPTTLAVVTVNEEGERAFQFYRSPGADTCLSEAMVSKELLEETKLLHFGSVSMSAEPGKSATIAAVNYAKHLKKIVTYDPNFRASLWEDSFKAIETMRSVLPLVDIIKLSDEETELLTGIQKPERAAEALEEIGISLILVTLGSKGVLCRWHGKTILIPGESVTVADTNGAGDTFFGAFLSRLVKREMLLENLEMDELQEMLKFANRAAAITVSRPGAIPAMPTLKEMKI